MHKRFLLIGQHFNDPEHEHSDEDDTSSLITSNGHSKPKKPSSPAAYSAVAQHEDNPERQPDKADMKTAAAASNDDTASLLSKRNVFSEKEQKEQQAAKFIQQLFNTAEEKINDFCKLSSDVGDKILNDIYENKLEEAKKIIEKNYRIKQYAEMQISFKGAIEIFSVSQQQLSGESVSKLTQKQVALNMKLFSPYQVIRESTDKLRTAIRIAALPQGVKEKLHLGKLQAILAIFEEKFKEVFVKENAAQPTPIAAAKK